MTYGIFPSHHSPPHATNSGAWSTCSLALSSKELNAGPALAVGGDIFSALRFCRCLIYWHRLSNPALSRGIPDPPPPPKLGIRTLVKELREIDIDGAPILFHAASSRREHSCFRTVSDLVGIVLGKGGLMEQVEAVDGLGRRLLMHAARSNDVNVFRRIFDMCKEAAGNMMVKDQQHLPQPATKNTADAEEELLREVLIKKDHIGMNCLHHAADAGCWEVLQEVIDKSQEAGGTLYEDMDKPDKSGCTPIMYVLSNRFGCGEGEHDDNNLKIKFDMLYEAMPFESHPVPGGHRKKGWMEPSPVPPRVNVSEKRNAPTAKDTRAMTELMHAARGGLASLNLVLNNPLPSSVRPDGGINLDAALNVELSEHDGENYGPWERPKWTQTWGRAMLLAAAAKLGDVDVLYHVLDAIKVGQ